MTTIGFAFNKKVNLKVVNIPSNVTDIHWYAFYHCKVDKLFVNGCSGVDVSSFTSVENLYYDTYDTLVNVGKRARGKNLFIGGEQVKVFVVPEGVIELPSSLFSACKSVDEVVLPSTLKKIGSYAFSNCAISDVALPASLTLINSGAFHTTKIESIDIPEGVEIGSSVFSCCYNLKSIKLPQSLTVIRGALLSNCMSLTEITIPESVTAIEKDDFYGCKLTSLVLPAGLKTIGNEAFGFLPLTEITIPASVTQIGEYVFEGCEILQQYVLLLRILQNAKWLRLSILQEEPEPSLYLMDHRMNSETRYSTSRQHCMSLMPRVWYQPTRRRLHGRNSQVLY